MEIEIRAFVDSLDEIKSTLEKLGAESLGEVEIVDHWFCSKKIYEGITMRSRNLRQM